MANRRNAPNRLLATALSDAITVGVAVWAAYAGGTWLDARFHTSPVFLAVLVLLAVGGSLQMVVKDMLRETGGSARGAGRRTGRNPGGAPGASPEEPGKDEEDR
ncbi:MAG: AtpZ/AtpI family protein [Clostridia bacterium]|nr:AtpZ/AtpI family protein [Clostridia bacterium]MCL6521085.1 AtpZ/AtpI family protein [Bacillota bacterium]